MTNLKRRFATAAMSAGIATLVPGVPVDAHPLHTNGGKPETLDNDWSASGHLLCMASNQGCSGHAYTGGTVAAWQRVLYADYYIANCGSMGIDGRFGQYTHDATKRWQEDWGLTVDGQVGPQTWGRADNHIARTAVTERTIYYYGLRSNVYHTVGAYAQAHDYYNTTPSGNWWTSHPGDYGYPYC